MNTDKYMPGVRKLMHHTEHLSAIKNGEIVGPIHVSVWPTLKCQLKCKYCCVRNETGDQELSLVDFKHSMEVLKECGLKAVEFSGGGDPLMWSEFGAAVEFAHRIELKISLITNGLALDNLPTWILGKLDWVRVSIQSHGYLKKLNLDKARQLTNVSLSYISDDTLEIAELWGHCLIQNMVCRVTTPKPCTLATESKIARYVESLGSGNVFFVHKERGRALGCYMPWIRAAIDWRGNFLPCPSMHLNTEYLGAIPEKFKLCHIRDLETWLANNRPHDMGYGCEFCNCGKENNDFIHGLLNETNSDIDFV